MHSRGGVKMPGWLWWTPFPQSHESRLSSSSGPPEDDVDCILSVSQSSVSSAGIDAAGRVRNSSRRKPIPRVTAANESEDPRYIVFLLFFSEFLNNELWFPAMKLSKTVAQPSGRSFVNGGVLSFALCLQETQPNSSYGSVLHRYKLFLKDRVTGSLSSGGLS